MPNIVVIGQEGQKEKLEVRIKWIMINNLPKWGTGTLTATLQYLNDANGEDHFSSRIGVGGLLNADKVSYISKSYI